MKKIRTTLVLMTLLMLVFSCTTGKFVDEDMREKLNNWEGHNKSKLIRQMGPPDRREPDGNGGTILIYEEYSTSGVFVANNYVENTAHRYIMFYTHADGEIYHWKAGTD